MSKECEYCQRGDASSYLAHEIYDAGCFGKIGIDMFIGGLPDGDPHFCISAFLVGADAEISDDRTKIYYCPICGRKLR
ncbi:MAG: hypothetical protein LUD72_02055 [Bacteroidales bacterium]|nr:hypothetical protein [Bacteroidales bacterium]